MPSFVDDEDLAHCASASRAHFRSVAGGTVAEDDPFLRFPVTVRRGGRTASYALASEYVDATLAHRQRILGAAGHTAREYIEDAQYWGQSIILVRGISNRLDDAGQPLSSLGFSHIHVRDEDGWKIIAIISDDS